MLEPPSRGQRLSAALAVTDVLLCACWTKSCIPTHLPVTICLIVTAAAGAPGQAQRMIFTD